jgi:hypothetical protein
MLSQTAGDYYELTFYCSGVSVNIYDGGARSAKIYVDAVLETTWSGANTNVVKAVFAKAGLTPGKHTIRVEVVTGPIHIDAFDILPSSLLTLDNAGSAEADVSLFVEAAEKEFHADFLGKVPNSTTANKHIGKYKGNATLIPPSDPSWTELNMDGYYNQLSKKDGMCFSTTASTVSMQLHTFDQSSIHSDIAKLRANTRSIDLRFFGHAYGVNAGADNHEAEVLAWNRVTSAWDPQGYAGMGFTRASVAQHTGKSVFTEVLTFAGKAKGAVTTCPHVAKYIATSSLTKRPDEFPSEIEQTWYDKIVTSDSIPSSITQSTTGNYAQMLISFDLLSWIRSRFLGEGSFDLATLKAVVKKLEATVICSGSGEGGNGATAKIWTTMSNQWVGAQTNSSATPTAIIIAPSTLDDKMDANGVLHVLVHSTNAADADTPSIISTDYVQLSVTVDLSAVKSNQPRYEGSNFGLLFDGTNATPLYGIPAIVSGGKVTTEFYITPQDFSQDGGTNRRLFAKTEEVGKYAILAAIGVDGKLHAAVLNNGVVTQAQTPALTLNASATPCHR